MNRSFEELESEQIELFLEYICESRFKEVLLGEGGIFVIDNTPTIARENKTNIINLESFTSELEDLLLKYYDNTFILVDDYESKTKKYLLQSDDQLIIFNDFKQLLSYCNNKEEHYKLFRKIEELIETMWLINKFSLEEVTELLKHNMKEIISINNLFISGKEIVFCNFNNYKLEIDNSGNYQVRDNINTSILNIFNRTQDTRSKIFFNGDRIITSNYESKHFQADILDFEEYFDSFFTKNEDEINIYQWFKLVVFFLETYELEKI